MSTTSKGAKPTAPKPQPPATKPLGKKRKEDDVKEEEVQEIEKEPEVVIRDPYDLLESVWTLPLSQQRSQVAKIFGMPDAPGISYQSLMVDDTFHLLTFLHELKLTKCQTRYIHSLMGQLRGTIRANPNISAVECFEPFRTSLFSASVAGQFRRAQAAEALEEALENSPPDSKTTNIRISESISQSTETVSLSSTSSSSSTLDSSSSASSASPNNASFDTKSVTTLLATTTSFSSTSSSPDCVPLSVDQCRSIIDYFNASLFKHFFLYRTVSDPAFQPRRLVSEHQFFLETPTVDNFSLDDAAELPDDGTIPSRPVLPSLSHGIMANHGDGLGPEGNSLHHDGTNTTSSSFSNQSINGDDGDDVDIAIPLYVPFELPYPPSMMKGRSEDEDDTNQVGKGQDVQSVSTMPLGDDDDNDDHDDDNIDNDSLVQSRQSSDISVKHQTTQHTSSSSSSTTTTTTATAPSSVLSMANRGVFADSLIDLAKLHIDASRQLVADAIIEHHKALTGKGIERTKNKNTTNNTNNTNGSGNTTTRPISSGSTGSTTNINSGNFNNNNNNTSLPLNSSLQMSSSSSSSSSNATHSNSGIFSSTSRSKSSGSEG